MPLAAEPKVPPFPKAIDTEEQGSLKVKEEPVASRDGGRSLAPIALHAPDPVAEKKDGGSTAEVAAKPPVRMPATVTNAALATELKNHANEQKLARSSMQKERARLEELKGELDASRTALKEETARLEATIAAARSTPGSSPTPTSIAPVPVKPATKQQRPQLQALAKTIKGMKPEQAALMVARLDRQLASDILREMKPAEAGAILDKLKPELAADLIATMAAQLAPQKDVL